MQWKTFRSERKTNITDEKYEEYRDNCRCGVCHKKLEQGDLFDLRAIQSIGEHTAQAVIVHKDCLDEGD